MLLKIHFITISYYCHDFWEGNIWRLKQFKKFSGGTAENRFQGLKYVTH